MELARCNPLQKATLPSSQPLRNAPAVRVRCYPHIHQRHVHPRLGFQVAKRPTPVCVAGAVGGDLADNPPPTPESAKLVRDCNLIRRLSWFSFWGQLSLSIVSGVIVVFALGARDPGALPPPSTWLAVTGVAFGLVSTFFSWTYRQAATALRNFVGNVEPRDVVKRLELGAQLNLLGMGASILALQAEVGSLLTKTLTSSAANPYAARATQAPVAFDVFTVQASTNIVMCHFVGLLFTQWILRILNRRITRMLVEQAS